MKYKTIAELEEEVHPWHPYVPCDADKIIFGTFPTAKRNRSNIDFYYPNPNNEFWSVLRAVKEKSNNVDTSIIFDKDERIKLLDDLNLGIADMGKKVLRHGNCSLDSNLFVKEFTDVFKLLDKNQKVKKLIFCSSSGENSVEGWFRSYCKLNNIKFPKMRGTNPKRRNHILNGREIEIVTVHSTSRATRIGFNEIVEMYKNEIIA